MPTNPINLTLNGFNTAKASPQLQPFIDNFWTVKLTTSVMPSTHLLHCDGGSGLLFNFASPIKVADNWLTNSSYVCAPFFKSQTMLLRQNTHSIGVRFTPAATKLFSDLKAKEILGTITTHVSRLDLDYLYEQLAQHTTFYQKIAVLESFFQQYIAKYNSLFDSQDRYHAHSLFSLINRYRGVITLSELAHRTGLHIKKIERLFAQYIGVSFRQCCQIVKVKLAMQQLKTQPKINFAELALNLNYFDQPHFNKQFKQIVGVTPARYRQQKFKPSV